jgi:filamentous hemagglutinin
MLTTTQALTATRRPQLGILTLGGGHIDVAVTGSGIGVLSTRPDVPPGDIDLYAPKGFIDAGEAGIRSSGNLTLYATEIRNTANISVGGLGTGVPASVAAPSLSLAAMPAPTRVAEGQSDVDKQVAEAQRSSVRPRVLILEFLGFGSEGEESWRRRRPAQR